MDTVRADHLSLYGYRRPTSPTLERWPSAVSASTRRAQQPPGPSPRTPACLRAAGPMNSMWIGSPLGTKFPTLAEDLGSRGYATAGFVGNVQYCSYDFGLNRGFTHYEDYVLEPMTPLRMCYLGDLALKGASRLGWMLSSSLGAMPFLPREDSMVWPLMARDSKIDAGSINRKFLEWLSGRREPARPFFAFLNYIDAHSAYFLPPGTRYRFGRPPKTDVDVQVSSTGTSLTSSGCHHLT